MMPVTTPVKFDFGTPTSPVAAGFTKVDHTTVYSATTGFGLAAVYDSRDRASGTDAQRDFVFNQNPIFLCDLANGTYTVTILSGDAASLHDKEQVWLQNAQVGELNPTANQYVTGTFTVSVSNGQLKVQLKKGPGAQDGNCVINAIEITDGGSPPPPPPPPPTINTATRDGTWSDATLWSAGHTPQVGEHFTTAGHDVLLNMNPIVVPPPPPPVPTPNFITLISGERIPDLTPTIESNPIGLWSNPATWNLNRTPQDGDIIKINGSIIYDLVSSPRFQMIIVSGGSSLVWSENVDTEMKVGTILIKPQGNIQQLALDGVRKHTVIWIEVPANQIEDPDDVTGGLINLGRREQTGKFKSGKVEVAISPIQGDSFVQLNRGDHSWEIGDRVVLGDMRNKDPNDPSFTEERIISDITNNGTRVWFSSPLSHTHPAGKSKNGSEQVLLDVGVLTHNLLWKVENPAGRRPHYMDSRTTTSTGAQWFLQGVECRDGGRTTVEPVNVLSDAWPRANLKGRYDFLHDHHNMVMGNQARGNSCWNTTPNDRHKWGATFHDTSYCELSYNCFYNKPGSGFQLEGGMETCNEIHDNLVVECRGHTVNAQFPNVRDVNKDSGWEGSGGWVRCHNENCIDDNSFIACTIGYSEIRSVLPESMQRMTMTGTMETFNPYRVPITCFRRNKIGGCVWGLTHWEVGMKGSVVMDNMPASEIEDLQVANIYTKGWYNYLTNGIRYNRLRAYGGGGQVFVYGGHYRADNFEMVDSFIEGWQYGVMPLTLGNIQRYIRCHFDNQWSVRIVLRSLDEWQRMMAESTNIYLDDCTFAQWNLRPDQGGPYDIAMDGTLSSEVVIPATIRVYKTNNGVTQRVYFTQQQASFTIPNFADTSIYNPAMKGLTNQQCLTQLGQCWGGEIAPANAHPEPFILGLVA